MDSSRRSRSSQKYKHRNVEKQAWTSSTSKRATSDDDFEHIELFQPPSLQELLSLLTTKLPDLARKAQTEVEDAIITGSDRSENRKLKSINVDLQEKNERLDKQIKVTETKCQDEISKLKLHIEQQRKEIDKLKNVHLQEQMLNAKRLIPNQDDNTIKRKLQSYDRMELKLKETENKLRLTEIELDETKTRLSRSMGEKLTDNNPNIADLSDKNRPTKLGERYKELYDNQWTEAFETVYETYRNEEKTIGVLINILMDTITFCEKEAKTQTKEIQYTITQKQMISGDIPAVVNKNIKEFRKNVAEFSGRQIYKKYQKELSRSGSSTARVARRIPNYVEECFKICWLMTVNDPPVVFGPNISVGEMFNTDMYTAYTKSGNKVEFVVWPALLLHANGPVLCKGVAQGFGEARGSKSAPPKSKIESVFNKVTSENKKQFSPPVSHQQKQDSYSQTTVATKKSTYKVPSRHDIEMFMEWREIFGKERARDYIGGEKYDNIRLYCIHNRLI
ncbi:uncharacterized protein LOC123558887 [Mercenaria mercenaria]|uniref:uncharacterized protein LOC123558887 n=1 Tax=Mercenaria mercenaria TaxID=6596 RepID=UPI001E1D545B|nr:uncharacterized protein LOC123558887 [Mercenaria mercenaria]